jgi:propionyl-CoA synthetase
MYADYQTTFTKSIDDPEGFWGGIAEDLHWEKKWDRVLDDSNKPFYRWFAGGQLNTCYNAVDYHVENGRADQAAVIYDSPVTDTKQTITFRELRDEIAKLAGGLRAQGVTKGDRVLIYMPMIPQTLMAMLACARIGAVHSVVFGGFAAKELATRIKDSKPKVIISASCGIEPNRIVEYKPLLDEAIELSGDFKPEKCIVFQRPQAKATMIDGRDLDFEALLGASEPVACVPVGATDPLYILYTSGTTGVPKGVLRDNGGHAAALAWSMKTIYDIEPGDVFWAASRHRLGGGALLHRLRPAARGGDDGDVRGQARRHAQPRRVLADHRGVQGQGALHGADGVPRHQARRPRVRVPQGARHLVAQVPVPRGRAVRPRHAELGAGCAACARHRSLVADGDGWAMAADCAGLGLLPVKDGSPTKPVPGWDLRVLDDDGQGGRGGDDRQHRRSSCRCRPGRCRRCSTTTRGTASRT